MTRAAQVVKQMREANPLMREPVWGHVLGVPVGARFAGRGELAACGVHAQILRGIDARRDAPACCIVASGGYQDDRDGATRLSTRARAARTPPRSGRYATRP